MEIYPGIEIRDLALFLPKERTLIISDLHLGFETTLHKKGVLIPRFYFTQLQERLKPLLTLPLAQVIINGDLKQEFGEITEQEWSEILQLLDFITDKVPKVIIIKGNHDVILKPIADKRRIELVDSYTLGDIYICHGDVLTKIKEKVIIIGHEHPAIRLEEGSKREMYKCFLKGTWKRKTLIVMPSFNLMKEGHNILEKNFLSPFLTKIDNFEVFVLGDE